MSCSIERGTLWIDGNFKGATVGHCAGPFGRLDQKAHTARYPDSCVRILQGSSPRSSFSHCHLHLPLDE